MTNLLLTRLKKGIKQYELAERVGITPQYLRLLEKGAVQPRLKLMKELSKALNVGIIELFFSDEEE